MRRVVISRKPNFRAVKPFDSPRGLAILCGLDFG